MDGINFELLKEAYAIVDGIPDDRFNLDQIAANPRLRERLNDPHSCGTIGCAAGWIAMHPMFQQRGLSLNSRGILETNQGGPTNYRFAMAEVFGIGMLEAVDLFGRRGDSIYDRKEVIAGPDRLNDKQLWQHRVRKFLSEHGQL